MKRHRDKETAKRNRVQICGNLWLCMVLLCYLTGCTRIVDVEDRNYVMVLGIDLAEESKDSAGGAILYQTTAKSLTKAEEVYKMNHTKPVDYGHVKAIVFSQALIESASDYEIVLNDVAEQGEIAYTIPTYIYEGQAGELVKQDENSQESLGDSLQQAAQLRDMEPLTIGERIAQQWMDKE